MIGETRRRPYQATYAVLALAVGGYALLQSLVIPVLPTIQAGVHTSQNSVTWVLTAYLLSAAIFTPIMGRLGDMYGKERLLVITLVALTVGSLLAAIASTMPLMIVARVIQGVGGGVLPLSFGLIRDEFPKEKVIGAIGVIAALAAAGAGLGIALAGPIVDALNYHWLFWIPMIVMALGAVAAHYVVPESQVRTPGMISWAGVLLLSAWLVALILGISEAPTWGWGSTSVIALIVVAVVSAVVWVVVEARSAHPLIDMNMMRVPAVWTTNLVALLLGVGMYAVFAFLPEFLQTPTSAGYGFGVSITKSGLILLPMSIFMFAFGMLSGTLSKRFGSKSVLVTGLLIGIFIDRLGLKVLAIMFVIAVPVVAFTGTPGLSDVLLLVMAFLSGCVVTGMQNALNASAGLIYPTSLRANGVGYALGVGRVGSVSEIGVRSGSP